MPLEDQDPNSFSAAWEGGKILFVTFLLGGLAGLAALLRSKDKLTRRAVASACLNSSLLSMAAAAMWWWHDPNVNFIALVFVSVMVGIGGNTSLGILTAIFFKKFNIVVSDPKKDGKSKD